MKFPQRPPVLKPTLKDIEALIPHLSPTLPDGRYLHWDDLRRRPPPPGLTRENWWFAHKLARTGNRILIKGFVDTRGEPFSFCRLNAIDRATHLLDRRDAVREMIETIGDDGVRAQYRIDQLMEEAINSSLVEGAQLTTRAQAKEMIADDRPPTSKGERMVLNNYRAMQRLLENTHQPLSLGDLLEIHSILGENALDAPDGEGRLRTAEDNVRVEDAVTGDLWFTPPPAGELEPRLEALLEFANADSTTQAVFLHPLLRAIILHFWMAYLHPFVDGNGRMARALFYWQMLRSRYDFAQYLSISGPIERSHRTYYRAFVLSETDDGDLTYFLINQLSVLEKATAELIDHVTTRGKRLNQISQALGGATTFNNRQQAVLSHLLRTPGASVTVTSHANSHGVTYLTARKDLQSMEADRWLERTRVGKTDRYIVSREAKKRIK